MISKYLWHKQSGLKSKKNLKEVVVVVAQKKHQNVEMACSANQEQVFLPLHQSGVSNFALVERKIKKMPCVSNNQNSINFALYVTESYNRNK